MALAAGTHLGPYEILAPLGAGGMGEVYRARDARLGRDVAVKVLPIRFAADAERLRRFEQEARAAGVLNHPNITSVYDVGMHEGSPYVVSELLEGETLRSRLAGAPLPARRAVDYALQVARGLAAAHEKGIVHRDLKPENLFVTEDGRVKVLDFGLAKLRESAAPGGIATEVPTATAGTEPGVILGTMGYMSPEQVRGQPLDHRSDIFSFGAILYEMLTGRRAFRGDSAADTMSTILREDPPEITSAGEGVSPALERVVRHCLEKSLEQRFQSARDLAFHLETVSGVSGTAAPVGLAVGLDTSGGWVKSLPWALACVLAVAAAVAVWGPRRESGRSPDTTPIRFAIRLPAEEAVVGGPSGSVALSPDGHLLVYAARRGGKMQLFVRPRDRLEATPIPGTDGGVDPFFSPDGQWIGFTQAGTIKKVALAGGPAVTVTDSSDPAGVSWGPDGTILLNSTWGRGLARVPATGGTLQPVTTPNYDKGEGGHLHPQFLPGGRSALFTVWTKASWDKARIEVVSLATGERKTLIEGGHYARYSPTGHLLFVRSGTLLAAPFDLARLEVTGEPVPVLDGVRTEDSNGSASYAIAADGTLAYLPAPAHAGEGGLLWVDRQGRSTPASEDRESFSRPRLSPDGRRVAVVVEGATFHIWIYDLTSGARMRFTSEADNGDPVWTPDGRRLAYWSNREGPYHLFWALTDGSAPAERLAAPGGFPVAGAFSPDGRTLAFTQEERQIETRQDIWVVPMEGDRNARAFLRTAADELSPAFSPDGRWIAYVSDESGRAQVHVTAFPGPGPKWQISADGGDEPVWNPSGGELFYRHDRDMLAVPVWATPEFRAGRPVVLFSGDFAESRTGELNYDVARDGKRFLMLRSGSTESASREIRVVVNWFEELKRRTGGSQRGR